MSTSTGIRISAAQLRNQICYSCPSCPRTFDSERGMKIHHAQTHGTSLNEQICDHCDESFIDEHGYRETRFCSPDCWHDHQREGRAFQHECAHCDATFESSKSDRQYCSMECRREDSTVLNECETCGDEFRLPMHKATGDASRYCSEDCKYDDLGGWGDGPSSFECSFCGDEFHSYEEGRQYCCPAHYHEDNRDRPDDLEDHLRELFVDEDRSISDSARRIPGHGYDYVRNRLVEFDMYDPETDAPLAQRLAREDVTYEDIDALTDDQPDGVDHWQQYY